MQFDAGNAFGSISHTATMAATAAASQHYHEAVAGWLCDEQHALLSGTLTQAPCVITTTQGIAQGGAESPMLFALAMSSVERTFWQRLVDTTGLPKADLHQHIRVWMYVDDVTLRASDGWQLLAKEAWEAASAAHGLLLRHDKTT
eukprot:758246-Amphidinium_carterae.1